MKLQDLFKKTIDYGIAADPRTKEQIKKILQAETDRQKKLDAKKKTYADPSLTWNPYHDSRILYGTGKEEVTHLMVGIDIEMPELLLADRLREKGKTIDAIFIHHPEGRALAELDKVMPLGIDMLVRVGVPENVSESLLTPHQGKIARSIHAQNLLRVERTAELLQIPIFTCHTPTDNLAWRFIEKHICNQTFDSVHDIVDALHDIPEYDYYAKKGNSCFVACGNGRPGKIVCTEFTGGTNGPEDFIEAQAKAGVGTIISMHATEKCIEVAKKHHIRYVQCSHMASDSLGINLMLDKIQQDDPSIQILEVSGFIRVQRSFSESH